MSIDVTTPDEDAAKLAALGYKQELHRGMSAFSNFAVSFSIISVLAGCITTYYLAMDGGGPMAINLGWPLCSIMVLCVAMAMGEICSVYPTSGGLYFWAGRLARTHKREWAWYTGWFNFMGEVGVTASVDYGAAVTWMAFASEVWGTEVTLKKTFALFLIFVLLHGLLNTFGVNIVKILSSVSAWWHLAGVGFIVVVLAFVPDHHQSASYVFTHTNNGLGFADGLFSTPVYAFFIGLLMAQYTLTGYDASAHMAEETHDATRQAPKGIVRSVWVSAIAGWILLIAVTAAIQNFDKERASATGLPPAQIFLDAAGRSLGLTLLVICGVAQFFCGMACVTSNSRMSYAFSRDGALPGSRIWAKVNPRTGTPTNSIWLCVTCSVALTLPALWNATAFFAVVSVAVIGLYIAYTVPIYLRRRNREFTQGDWHLGRWSAPIGWIAVAWVAFIVVMFMLPQYSPGTIGDKTFNYAPVAVVGVLLFASVMWLVTGRKHFMRDVPEGHDTRPAAELLED
ncbi:amino acid permease [Luteipulveratus mongoliensis]|uniref:Amino acid permease n=1 Tax=Luteipulveratus mongoliensis TaxID=571913 RepID=A0A0K1JJR7_9MICO|nr:amino acid permease [Luteipulveratus mongoliensis]AKU16962.1 amino acid permease [Luteipulveratus mongoliensis]